MTVQIDRSDEDIRASYERVLERVRAAQNAKSAPIELTQQEAFDMFNRQEVYNTTTGVCYGAGVDMKQIRIGMEGTVLGFPCVIVERLASTESSNQ